MNSVSVQQKRFIRLTPSNNASAGFSPDSSQPIVRFSVADTMASADMTQARLNFRIRVSQNGNNSVNANTQDFNVDKTVNACGILDQVIVSSRRFGNQIEAVHNLGRLNSSWYSSLYSPKQMAANVNMNCRSVGKGKYNGVFGNPGLGATLDDGRSRLQRKYLVTSNAAPSGAAAINHKNSWCQGQAQAAGTAGEVQAAGYMDCSIPLHLGFFQSSDVNLNQVGGLEITCYLAQTRSLFYGAGADGPGAGSTYNIVDVNLTVPLLYYTAQQVQAQLAQPESVLSFMSWTSIYSVLDSTFTSIAHRLALKGLLSSIHNTLPTLAINNNAFNNHALINSGIESLTFLREGVKNPYEKTTIPTTNSLLPLANKSCLQPEILNDYISAWRNPRDVHYTQIIPENILGRAGVVEGVYGIGCNYDPSAGAGVSVNGTISYDIKTKLEDITTPNPATTESYAFYSFYLSRQDYVVTGQGMSSI
tara:strand:+ start:162 stop:1589 length:1428 start_codon:yes stop_codon:yes gene_type:complete